MEVAFKSSAGHVLQGRASSVGAQPCDQAGGGHGLAGPSSGYGDWED